MESQEDVIITNISEHKLGEADSREEDDDQLIAEYDILITPEISEQLYLIQHTNRMRNKHPVTHQNTFPRELRTKTRTGFMEIDLEIKPDRTYDKYKGAAWGQALKDAKEAGAAFGLGEGFGKGSRPKDAMISADIIPTGVMEIAESPASDGDNIDGGADDMSDGSEELTGEGELMKFHTVGGQIIPPQEGGSFFMLGTFHKGTLHLSHVNGTAQLRPQFHHIDAKSQLAKEKVARKKTTTEAAARLNEPRLVQQSARTAIDDEEINIAKTAAFLTAASEEKWAKQKYHDSESDAAIGVYSDKLFAPLVKENSTYLDYSGKSVDLSCPLDKDNYMIAVDSEF